LRRPDLTALVLHDGWYHTGDTGHIDQNGAIRLSGRLKDEINRAGFKVHPVEIETLLMSHPGISDACVFGITDSVSGEVVAAAVCGEPGRTMSAQELQQWCVARLRRDAIPERWFFVDKLPRNERGKVNRNAVRRMVTGDAQ
jgi:acyl-CoA synthetase (AMP-forming)/AMP-acid ligase II